MALNSGNDGARKSSVMERNAERELFFLIVGLVPRHKEAKNSREHRKDDDCRDDDRDFCRYPHRENRPWDRARRAAYDHAGRLGHVELDNAAVFVRLFF